MKAKAMKLLGITLIAVLLIGLMPMAAFAVQSIDCVDILALHPVHLETPDMFVQVFGGARIDTDYNSGGYINGIRRTEEPSGFLISVDGRTATADRYTDSTLTVKVVFPTLVENTPSHTHTPSEWRTTQVYHYKVCTECGDMLDSEDHFGGKATCAEKGKCAECGYEYIEANEDHDPDTSKWVAYANKYHFHACKICGAHCDTEDHTPGEPADFDKAQVCTDCGYIIAPALLHKHELTRVERKDATCTEAGNIEHYTCNGCSEIFADEDGINAIPDATIAPLGHKLSDGFTNDEEYHWRTCSVCNELLEETKMAHEYENGKCMTCNFEAQPSESSTDDKSDTTSSTDTSADTSTDTSTAPSDASEPEPIEEDGGMPWWAIALIAVGCIAVVTVIAVFATKNKKKA